MKIVFFDLGSVWGGQEIYSASLMKSLVERGHEMISYSVHTKFSNYASLHRSVPISYRGFPQLVSLLNKSQRDVDLVHFNGNRALYLSCLVKKQKPFVGTKHLPYAQEERRLKRYLGTTFSPILFHNIDALIAVCRATREELPEKLKRRTIVIPNGVSSCLDAATTRPSVFTIIYVARLARHKGIMDALNAVLSLKQKGVPVRFLVAGSGEMRAEAENFVKGHGLIDCVEFLGFVEKVGPLYSGAHVCVLPSIHEGMPLNLLEAFSAGCPVVAYDIPGVNEVVEHGRNGFLVSHGWQSIAAALERLAVDPLLQSTLSDGARASYQSHYTLENMVERTLNVYESVMSSC